MWFTHLCRTRPTDVEMQPHQQTVAVQPVPMQPVYLAQPYQTTTVVSAYRRRQSMVIGVLLVICGCLSILCNIVDLAIGTKDDFYYTNRYFLSVGSLSEDSNGVAGHGLWAGAMVSILLL